ncbi:MAG TPA: hypothetical protein VIP51_10595 [Eoetvoesiella sp.]
MDLTQLFLGYPEFIWQGIFSLASTLIAGLIIAFVTTFYLKKKDEVTRVAGVVLEKRINSEQTILDFLESASFSLEMPKRDSQSLCECMVAHELTLPHGPNLQYAKVFSSNKEFQKFFRAFEQQVSRNKLWLSKEVRFHLELMQAYFAWINASLLVMQRIPLPDNLHLTDDETDKLADKILLIQGISLDSEFKGLIAHLEVLMVDSIYHLKLDRVKRSLMRNGFMNRDTKKMIKILDQKTILGAQREQLMALVAISVYAIKGVNPQEMDIDGLLDQFPE